MQASTRKLALKDALVAGLTTFVVDGIIQFFSLRGETPIAITVDSITNTQHTVFGSSVALALLLAVIMTIINYFKIKGPKVPFFPAVFLLMIRHGFFAFGVFTTIAVMWQRWFGTIEVGLFPAVLMVAFIAGIVSATVNYLTIERCVLPVQ